MTDNNNNALMPVGGASPSKEDLFRAYDALLLRDRKKSEEEVDRIDRQRAERYGNYYGCAIGATVRVLNCSVPYLATVLAIYPHTLCKPTLFVKEQQAEGRMKTVRPSEWRRLTEEEAEQCR